MPLRFLAALLGAAALAVPAAAQTTSPLLDHPCVLRVEDPGPPVSEASLLRLPTHTVERKGAAATFVVTYTGFTQEAETAFQRAVDIWSDHIESDATIRVNANFATLGPGVLGSAGAADLALNRPEFPFQNTVYPIALAEAIVGAEFPGVFGSSFDINATFSSAFSNFYFGTDGNTPPGEFDFVTIVLHELGHGLGFAGSARYDDGEVDEMGNDECTGVADTGCFLNTNLPFVYDRFIEDAGGVAITNGATYPENSAAFGSLITSNALYISGPSVDPTLGGPGRAFAPAGWQQGSSYSHWNEATYGSGSSLAMMTPQVAPGESHQDPGANTCAFFGDMGWPLAPACVALIQTPRDIEVTGNEGWRMLAAPDQDTDVDELLGFTHTQGFAGADVAGGAPNVYFYDESLPGSDAFGYRTPTSQSEALPLGRGLLAYLYADDDASTPVEDGGFPKTVAATGTPATTDFTWPTALLTYTPSGAPGDDGWNLLGNPFASAFDWDDAVRSGVDGAVYVYDDATSAYRSYSAGAGTLTDGIVSPFQAFWVQATAAAPALTLPPADGAGTFYRGEDRLTVALRLAAADGSPLGAAESAAFVVFGTDGAEAGIDGLDARALASLSPTSVSLATLVGEQPLAIDHRPDADGVETVALGVGVTGASSADLVLRWDAVEAAPGTRVTLTDRETGTELDLAAAGSYAFTTAGTATRTDGPALRQAAAPERFRLVVDASSVVSGESGPTAAALTAPAPNPVRRAASMRLTVPAPEYVRAAVYDALGREVAVLWDGDASGTAELRLDASALSAGVYVVRVAGESFAETQTLTVVR